MPRKLLRVLFHSKAESEQSSDKESNDEPKQKKSAEKDQRRIDELKVNHFKRCYIINFFEIPFHGPSSMTLEPPVDACP